MKLKAYGTHKVAKICHVTPPTVGRWIAEGLLPSFTTGGGHRRVWDEDLLVFLKSHNIPIPAELLIPTGPLRVLVVDDEDRLRKLVIRSLRRGLPEGEFHEAADGFEAGRKIAELIPALVVLDLRLPGLDGARVCESVRADEKLRDISVLAISGYDPGVTGPEALAAGADVFLPKPFRPDQILSEAKKLLPHSFL
ncbi:MAG: response regulator [Elusimicrobia bacterium]|jgi:CheY-like chemotaxis protein|nr:response regulator [Elusimicrobiota bacterium]